MDQWRGVSIVQSTIKLLPWQKHMGASGRSCLLGSLGRMNGSFKFVKALL